MLRLSSLLLLSTVAVAAPVPKATKSQLVVVTVDAKSGKSQLVLIGDDGGNPNELTDTKSNASYPAWSPDGKKIAFSSDRDGGQMQVFVMDADGTNVKQLTADVSDARASGWSSNGDRFVYGRQAPFGGSDVVVVDAADGKNSKVLVESNAWDPAFCPDGRRIAFVSNRDDGKFKLFLMDADGNNAVKLEDEGSTFSFAYPAWNPDGKKIAFGRVVEEHVELHTVGADGKGLVKLTDFGGMSLCPAFSPDGKKLAFLQYKSGEKAALILADADGKNPKAILKDFIPAEGGRPAWRPR